MSKSIKQIRIICVYHFKLCVRSPRVILLGILLLIYLHTLIEPILTFSGTVGFSPSPWFLPYLVNDYVCQMILTFGGVILFCDAPFHSAAENYLLIRTNYSRWRAGQILYIFSMALFYLVFINFISLSIMALGSGLESSTNWGKIWGTLANTDARRQFSISMSFSQYIYGLYTPAKAFVYTFLLEWGVISLLGLIIYNLNRVRSSLGTICAALLTLLDFAVLNSLPFAVYRFSPASWARLSVLTDNAVMRMPSVRYAFIAFSATLPIGAVLGILHFKTPRFAGNKLSMKKRGKEK
jgi:hypothetical protein